MEPVHLHFIWDYRDVDRAFWAEHLEDWMPQRIVDAHIHVQNEALRLHPVTPQMRRQYWVSEVSAPADAQTQERCTGIIFPGREVTFVCFGAPNLAYDTDAHNEYVRSEALKRGWRALAVLDPKWSAERVDAELSKPGIIGLKPYYAMISHDPNTRDRHLEASIFDFLPHHVLEVADQRGAWITLHVPKAERLGHPDNIREIKEIRRRYPRIILVIAHLGRCYTEPHALEGIPPLADDEGLYWDISAVFNPETFRIAMERIGPGRLLWGTDNPVFYMRGRRTWSGRTYFNYTSGDFNFNKGRHEPPEVEARYTLYTYEALRTIRQVCQECGVDRAGVEAIFRENALRLIRQVEAKKAGAP